MSDYVRLLGVLPYVCANESSLFNLRRSFSSRPLPGVPSFPVDTGNDDCSHINLQGPRSGTDGRRGTVLSGRPSKRLLVYLVQ